LSFNHNKQIHTMNASMKASAVNFAATLKPAVSLACLMDNADELRKQIANGEIDGVSFPAKRKKMGKGCQFRTPRLARLRKVHEINALRSKGVTARKAASDCNLSYQVYRHWSDDLGIEFYYNSLWGDSTNL